MTDFRKFNNKTLKPKKVREFDSVTSGRELSKIWKYNNLWSNLDNARRKRERAVKYAMGDQYSDVIKDEYGRSKTEGQYIMEQIS